MSNNSSYVLDSYALLAHLGRERGWKKVRELLDMAGAERCRLLMSAINLGEVLYVIERERGPAGARVTLARIDELPVEIVDVGRQVTLAAAHIKAHHAIAYADCFAAALTRLRGAILVTGDPEFKLLEKDLALPVIWL